MLSFILPTGITFTYIPEINKTISKTTTTYLSPGELIRIRGRGAAISGVVGNIEGKDMEPKEAGTWGEELNGSPSRIYSKTNIAMIKRNGDTSISDVVKDNKES